MRKVYIALFVAFDVVLFGVLAFIYWPQPEAFAERESYGLVIVVDGARGDMWKKLADEGKLPNTKRLFQDEGVWVEHASSVFPTITGAGMPSANEKAPGPKTP